MAKTLLIIEDDPLFGAELKRHYRRKGWRVMLANSLGAARSQLFDKNLLPRVVLADINLPDGNALDLFEEACARQLGGEWVFIAGYGRVADSVRALRLGAVDFLEKPVALQRLDLVIRGATRTATARHPLPDPLPVDSRRYSTASFVGQSSIARQLRAMLKRLAEAPISALIITGDTGTGKGVAARILHHSGSRHAAPLVEVNCSALPKDLLESELFGHEAGAFTGARGRRRGLFEQADGGTLFLDEIGEMPLDLQAKLLKALEEQRFRRVGGDDEIRVDVRVIAATNRDLAARIAAGDFREDLYHRLCVFELKLPPLRDRLQDLDELVPMFVAEFNLKSGKKISLIGEAVWERLRAHTWPGNIRELRNVIERSVLFADGDELPLQWLQLRPQVLVPCSDRVLEGRGTCTLHEEGTSIRVPFDGTLGLDDMDRFIICTALERNQHNVTATARMLNSTRDTLRYRIGKYAINLPEGPT
ncbi:MAG: two-component system response regulator AtoC [Motiliproteus sp.]|jgi:two-component system response regulator AtoC